MAAHFSTSALLPEYIYIQSPHDLRASPGAGRHGTDGAAAGADDVLLLVRGAALTICVTVVGWADDEERPRAARRRAPGRPGRRERAARREPRPGSRSSTGAPRAPHELVAAHLRPGRASTPGARSRAAGARAMIDLSDGIATDAAPPRPRERRAARSTSTRCRSGTASRRSPRSSASTRRGSPATGGEDFELCACLTPRGAAPQAPRRSAAWSAASPARRSWLSGGERSQLSGYEHPI